MSENRQGMVLTTADKRKLEEELNELKTVKTEQVKRDLAEARAHGDLSENAEYDEAKNEQARVAARIAQLQDLLDNAVVVDEQEVNTDTVQMGTVVTVWDETYEEEDEYTIVGLTESDASKLFISPESPIGAALVGAKVGDTVEAHTPGGLDRIQIKAIRRREAF